MDARYEGVDVAELLDAKGLILTSERRRQAQLDVVDELINQFREQERNLAIGAASPADAVARSIRFVEMFREVLAV